jgi:parvulin-like peptidyl-prolyl isomerase
MARIRKQVLEGLIDAVLIRQGAEALGVTVGDEEVESTVASDIVAGGGVEAFAEWLRTTGQTREDYECMVQESLLSQKVLEVVAAEVPTATEQVHARHIIVHSKAAAEEILISLREGADFEELTLQHSQDEETKHAGGELGWFPRGLGPPALERAIFALRVGEFSDVIRVGEQYHIIQATDREAARPLSQEGHMELVWAAFERWLDGMHLAAEIERFAGE